MQEKNPCIFPNHRKTQVGKNTNAPTERISFHCANYHVQIAKSLNPKKERLFEQKLKYHTVHTFIGNQNLTIDGFIFYLFKTALVKIKGYTIQISKKSRSIT